MKKNRTKAVSSHVTVEDYVKAVKKADREVEQTFRPGWAAKVKVHASKKTYDRKVYKKFEA